jgi:hypothetical protein
MLRDAMSGKVHSRLPLSSPIDGAPAPRRRLLNRLTLPVGAAVGDA